VRGLFRRYLEIGSVVRLKAIFDREDARLPLRTDGTGKVTGGGLISRGHLYKILSNPIYIGRLTHHGQAHIGLHDPIIDQETWDRSWSLLDYRDDNDGAKALDAVKMRADELRNWLPGHYEYLVRLRRGELPVSRVSSPETIHVNFVR
jgi:hypothetical protein